MERIFNFFEAALWLGFGAGVLIGARKCTGAVRRNGLLAASSYIALGISDVIEAGTGAWWRPWWLLAMKAICVVLLFACLWRHRRLMQARR